ncbi:MAG TPA: hypothetical protein VL863_05650 [bacterium]|nr:hypothetical protein [bacterium]
MSAEADTKPTGSGWPDPPPPETGWSWKKICFLIVLAFVAHLAFIFIFGAKKSLPARAAAKIPQFQLANYSDLVALEDPTLFALPHVEDFAPAIWRRTLVITSPSFRWTEPPPFLLPVVETLGAGLGSFISSNQIASRPLNFKPEPELFIPRVTVESMLPQHSTLEIAGDLGQRQLLTSVVVPTLAYPDVIAPSKVQVLVDPSGQVISTVLLPSDNAMEAAGRADIGETNALIIARGLRFTPAPGLTFGELIFNWHTVPTNAP